MGDSAWGTHGSLYVRHLTNDDLCKACWVWPALGQRLPANEGRPGLKAKPIVRKAQKPSRCLESDSSAFSAAWPRRLAGGVARQALDLLQYIHVTSNRLLLSKCVFPTPLLSLPLPPPAPPPPAPGREVIPRLALLRETQRDGISRARHWACDQKLPGRSSSCHQNRCTQRHQPRLAHGGQCCSGRRPKPRRAAHGSRQHDLSNSSPRHAPVKEAVAAHQFAFCGSRDFEGRPVLRPARLRC